MTSCNNHIYGGTGDNGGQSGHGLGGEGGRGEGPVINHHYSFTSNSGTTPEVNVMELLNAAEFQPVGGQVLTESEVYCSEMLSQKRGYPLYEPSPQRNLPAAYREHGVSIGDVGRVTSEGIFEFFFNVFCSAQDPINADNTPESFVPMDSYKSRDVTDLSYPAGNHVSTGTVERINCVSQYPGGEFLFNCGGISGAVLALPNGAQRQNLQKLAKLRKYVTEHAASWYEHINGPMERELANGDLCLITGHEKALSWGMASYYANTKKLKFSLTFKTDATQYRWVGVPGQTNPSKHKSYDRPEDPLNHTVFLHGWSISLGTGLWSRVFGSVTVETPSMEDFKSTLYRDGGFRVASPRGWLFLPWPFGAWGRTGGEQSAQQKIGEVILSDFPSTSKVCNPAQLINEYILCKAPNTMVVMTHDDHWCDILGDDFETLSPSDFLQRIDDQFIIEGEDGAAFLVSKSAHSRRSALDNVHQEQLMPKRRLAKVNVSNDDRAQELNRTSRESQFVPSLGESSSEDVLGQGIVIGDVNYDIPHLKDASMIGSRTNAHLSADTSRQRYTRKGRFEYRHGLRHHTHDQVKAPYPLAYSKEILELESIDLRLISHINGNSVSFVNFSDENWTGDRGVPATPEHSLDLGCGTGVWVIDAAKEWPNCNFVGLDLMDIQIQLKTFPPEYASVAERITWVHGNFLTNKLPFDDDEFDHIHVHAIAQGVPENKWGILFEEIHRVLRPGGVVEIMEDGKLLILTHIIFPLLPKWFTAPLRPRPQQSTSVHYPDGTHRDLDPFSDTQSDTTPHDHALLESLYKSVFESRFINLSPTAILPTYFTTYFRHVTRGPTITFFMPPTPPLQPLPPQILTSYVIDPNSDTFDSQTSTVFATPPQEIRTSFASATSASTNSAATSSQVSSLFTGHRTASSVSSYDSSDTVVFASNEIPDSPKTPAPFKSFVLGMGMDGKEPAISPDWIPLRNQLSQLNERSLAMHLYRSYQIVLACQEEMWEELKDRIRNRKEELRPFGWDDDEELKELQSRKKFELLVDRYRTDMQIRTALWCSLTGIGWLFPPREPLSKAELIKEEKIRAAMVEFRASQADSDDEAPSPCRSLRVLVGRKR